MISKSTGAGPALVLASKSAIRARLLTGAGLRFQVSPPALDEAAIKQSLKADGADARAVAETLAEMKACKVSLSRPEALVIGADQVLECNRRLYDKPADIDQARVQLRELRGERHRLHTAAVVARAGQPIWRQLSTPTLTMRAFGDGFLEQYLAETGTGITLSVGAYQLEGLGIQLFSAIEGDYFSILGLPLLPLIGFLRQHGLVGQ